MIENIERRIIVKGFHVSGYIKLRLRPHKTVKPFDRFSVSESAKC